MTTAVADHAVRRLALDRIGVRDLPTLACQLAHSGLGPDADIIPIITPAWATIIHRLQQHAQIGRAEPFATNP